MNYFATKRYIESVFEKSKHATGITKLRQLKTVIVGTELDQFSGASKIGAEAIKEFNSYAETFVKTANHNEKSELGRLKSEIKYSQDR